MPSSYAAGVKGPTSSTDEAVVRFDGTTGQLIKNSTLVLSNSGNAVTWNATGGGAQQSFSLGGTEALRIAGNQILALGTYNGVFAPGDGSTFVATRVRFGLDGNLENGSGLGCAATGTVTMLSGGTEIGRWTATTFTIASGVALKLGNAYVNTPSVSTGYLLITDSTGIVYEIPAKAH